MPEGLYKCRYILFNCSNLDKSKKEYLLYLCLVKAKIAANETPDK